MAEAMDRRVVLVTPTTLFALCKAVAYGWRAEDQAKNAARIVEVGRELYKRVSVMGAHADLPVSAARPAPPDADR